MTYERTRLNIQRLMLDNFEAGLSKPRICMTVTADLTSSTTTMQNRSLLSNPQRVHGTFWVSRSHITVMQNLFDLDTAPKIQSCKIMDLRDCSHGKSRICQFWFG